MRHGNKIKHLGRKSEHRKALLSNLASSLITHKHIITTTAKAKALRVFIEPLITKSKLNTTHSRRIVFSYLRDKDAVDTLFSDVAAKVATRPGGYTRIIKLEPRRGDAAEMALIELVDFSLTSGVSGDSTEAKSTAPKKRTRRGGAAKKQADTTSTADKPKVATKKTAAPKSSGGSNAPKIRQRKSGGA
ncbi:MAG: 50S ribosomal protein L17 [Bacteroidota bacterium]|jgi:large subunit ribosomal protein L17